MGLVLDVRPCCCGCSHFLPPWDIPAGPQQADREKLPPIRCAHAVVCVNWIANLPRDAARRTDLDYLEDHDLSGDEGGG